MSQVFPPYLTKREVDMKRIFNPSVDQFTKCTLFHCELSITNKAVRALPYRLFQAAGHD
jgi:hypothetical protein